MIKLVFLVRPESDDNWKTKYSITEVAKEIGCTRQHLYNELNKHTDCINYKGVKFFLRYSIELQTN